MSLCNICLNIRQPYCEHTPYQSYKKSQQPWEQGYEGYIKKNQWFYNFENEDTVSDCEQSFLSQMIFGNLLKSQGYFDFTVDRRTIFVYRSDNEKIKFYFDVMNNPKGDHELGRKAKAKKDCEEIWVKWYNIYHTIGNFTPIPWPLIPCPNNPQNTFNLQKKHNWLNERWDKMLKYCRENWDTWDKNVIDISFDEYIKRTCQHLYFEDIFVDFKKEYGNKLDKITSEEWEELVRSWNDKIDEDKCKEILTFEGDIKEIADKIVFLIEARGRCIISLLGQELS